MDIYSRTLVDDFFSRSLQTSQLECHDYVQEILGPRLASSRNFIIKVEPNLFQGSLSYTCVMHIQESSGTSQRTIVQFRHEEVDLWGNIQAHRLFGHLAPPIASRGTYRQLYFYTSPLIPGKPFIELLILNKQAMSRENRLRTLSDLAKILTRKADAPTQHPSAVNTDLYRLHLIVDNYKFRDRALKCRVKASMSKIQQSGTLRASLPLVLTHVDMTPMNYLVDETSGQVTAVLDWDGARYLPIGQNFHFVEHLFGCLSRDGWEDYDDRGLFKRFFDESIRRHLASQGVKESDLAGLELERTYGILTHYVPKLLQPTWRHAEGILQHFFP